MIDRIIITVRIIIEEIECNVTILWLAKSRDSAKHLGGIGAPLVAIHHRKLAWLESDAGRDISIDAGSHGVTTLCLDDNDAISTT